jgi:hypothetical protein
MLAILCWIIASLKHPYALCHSHWVRDRCPFEFMCRYGPYMVEVSIAHTCMSYRICPPLLICFFKINNHLFSFLCEHYGSPEFISSHRMEKMLKKGHSGVIAQLHVIQATETPLVPHDLQALLYKHQMVFYTPQGLPPSRGVHDHSIPLVPGSLPPNIRPYRHPFSQKNEIEKMVQELLNASVIHPSTSPYSSTIVTVLKK